MDTNGVLNTYRIMFALMWASDCDTGRKKLCYMKQKHHGITVRLKKKKHKLQKHTGSKVCISTGEQIWLEAGKEVRWRRGSALRLTRSPEGRPDRAANPQPDMHSTLIKDIYPKVRSLATDRLSALHFKMFSIFMRGKIPTRQQARIAQMGEF